MKRSITFSTCNFHIFRTLCNCTQSTTISTDVDQSDCISKVYRLVYPEKLVPSFFIQHQSGKQSLKFRETLRLSEVNLRTDYTLIDSVRTKDGIEVISTSHNTSIELEGSGLYHFKAEILQKNTSFCDLQTQFVVYVDNTPLPHPADDIVRAYTAFVFGFVLLALFLYQYYKPKSF